DERIQELEQDVERYKAEIEVEPEPLSSSEAITEVAMVE
ncbi:MAG TPA: DUF1049 domain-containing protein, partial [Cyanobacteria bacterium UBA12227]|nr:DUF1049 domain-containing protein [Cyanobacteria bacterium UBA12227]